MNKYKIRMDAILIVHFGSPKNETHVGELIRAIFSDPFLSPLQKNIFLKLLSWPIAHFAIKKSIEKYKAIDFGSSYITRLEKFGNQISEFIKPAKLFMAAQYGPPSIEDSFEQIDEAGIKRTIVVPMYPHASPEMYGSIVKQCQRLQSRFYRDIHLVWTSPFFREQHFIDAWVHSIEAELAKYPEDECEKVHLLFSAHAHPLLDGAGVYTKQVEESAKLIWQALGVKNPMSVAYQSATRFGKWTTPKLEDEIRENSLVIPISFLFDNMEVYEIRHARKVSPPAEQFFQLFRDMISATFGQYARHI